MRPTTGDQSSGPWDLFGSCEDVATSSALSFQCKCESVGVPRKAAGLGPAEAGKGAARVSFSLRMSAPFLHGRSLSLRTVLSFVLLHASVGKRNLGGDPFLRRALAQSHVPVASED